MYLRRKTKQHGFFVKYVSFKIKRHLTVDVTPIPYIYEVKKTFFKQIHFHVLYFFLTIYFQLN